MHFILPLVIVHCAFHITPGDSPLCISYLPWCSEIIHHTLSSLRPQNDIYNLELITLSIANQNFNFSFKFISHRSYIYISSITFKAERVIQDLIRLPIQQFSNKQWSFSLETSEKFAPRLNWFDPVLMQLSV